MKLPHEQIITEADWDKGITGVYVDSSSLGKGWSICTTDNGRQSWTAVSGIKSKQDAIALAHHISSVINR